MNWVDLILDKNFLARVCIEMDTESNAFRFEFEIEPKGVGRGREKILITLPLNDLETHQFFKSKDKMKGLLREVFDISPERGDLDPAVQFLEQADTTPYWDELEDADDIKFVEDDLDYEVQYDKEADTLHILKEGDVMGTSYPVIDGIYERRAVSDDRTLSYTIERYSDRTADDLMKLPKDLRTCIIRWEAEGMDYIGEDIIKDLVARDYG